MSQNGSDDEFDAFLRRVLDRLPAAEPPPGFARRMAKLVADQPETGTAEGFVTRVLLGLAILATAACTVLYFDSVVSRVDQVLDRAPWPLLLTAAVAIGAIRLTELAHRSRSE